MKRTRSSYEENAMRSQLAAELHKKKHCAFETYECTKLSIDGYDYCFNHILTDKNAPYKQCTYIYQSNGKKCHLPALKSDKKESSYCSEHALKSNLSNNRKNSKCSPVPTAESILHSLTHYIKPLKESHSGDNEVRVTKSIDPFVDLDANAVSAAQCNEILDMCSESESDIEPATYSTVWHDVNFDSSDDESIDSDHEDPLKHANVYTAEEISSITRDKLVRLQSLYIEEYRYLQYLLKEKRRKYLHALKREKETCCSIYNQVHDNPKEQRLYYKLKQFKKYHKTQGVDAVLAKKLRELRAKVTDGLTPKLASYQKCSFTEGGVKCGERTLPMAKHCRKHILEDTSQVLFKACGKMIGDLECNTPVEAIFDDSPCQLHMEVPILRAYDKPRKDSESDQDDTLDLPPDFSLSNNENVKTELMDYSMQQEIPKIMETLPTLLFEESADDMSFNTASQNSHDLDVTVSNNMDVDVTGEDQNPRKDVDDVNNQQDQQKNQEENTSKNETPSFLASLCVLDESKLEQLDKKWTDIGKNVEKKNDAKEVSKNEMKADAYETETKSCDNSETQTEERSDNISDHESYSKPANSEEGLNEGNGETKSEVEQKPETT